MLSEKEVTFICDNKTLAVLDKLKKKLGTSSRAEVIRRSLAFLDIVIEGSEGKPVAIQTKEGIIRVSF